MNLKVKPRGYKTDSFTSMQRDYPYPGNFQVVEKKNLQKIKKVVEKCHNPTGSHQKKSHLSLT